MIQTLLETSREQDTNKADFMLETNGLSFSEDANLVVPNALFNAKMELPLTDWALQQVCDKLGPPPFSYMQNCPAPLRASNLNHWLYDLNTNWFVRTYKEHIRGVLSSEYTPISNTEVLECIDKFLTVPYKLIRPHVDPDRLYLKVIVADSRDGNYGIGFAARNGEIGNSHVGIDPLIQRHSCDNSIRGAGEGWFQRHWRVTHAFIKGAIIEKIGQALKVSQDMLERLVEAQLDELPKLNDIVEGLAKQHGWNDYTSMAIMSGTEREYTRMGLVNGLSFAAHQTEDIMLTMKLEALAGAVLVNNSWQVKEE